MNQREFKCDKSIIDSIDGEIFTEGKIYKCKKRKPTLCGIGIQYFEIIDNNKKVRKISNGGENLLSNFSNVGKIYEVLKKISDDHFNWGVTRRAIKVSKAALERFDHTNCKKAWSFRTNDNESQITVYSFWVISEDKKSISEYNYIKEVGGFITENDASEISLWRNLSSIDYIKSVCKDMSLLKNSLMMDSYYWEHKSRNLNILLNYADRMNEYMDY